MQVLLSFSASFPFSLVYEIILLYFIWYTIIEYISAAILLPYYNTYNENKIKFR